MGKKKGIVMSKQIVALKLALEALEIRCGTNAEERGPYGAITAIREALAQPEQHQDWCASLTQMLLSMPPQPAPCNCKPPQPKQESVTLPPVQFEKVAEGIEVGYDFLGGVDIRLGGEFVYVHINYDYRYTHNAARKALADQIVGLLTTPPQPESVIDKSAAVRIATSLGWEPKRTWVGLTDEEIMDMYNEPRSDAEMIAFGREVEAKLKEKNNG